MYFVSWILYGSRRSAWSLNFSLFTASALKSSPMMIKMILCWVSSTIKIQQNIHWTSEKSLMMLLDVIFLENLHSLSKRNSKTSKKSQSVPYPPPRWSLGAIKIMIILPNQIKLWLCCNYSSNRRGSAFIFYGNQLA